MPARHLSIFTVLFNCTFLPVYYCASAFSQVLQESSTLPFAFDCTASGGWSFVGTNLVPFRNFSFGEAKAVDLAWNWVVERGLQGILSLLAYRVFSDALLRVVELSAVPLELYVTLALPSTKIELLWQVCKNLFKRGSWRVVLIFIWLIISTIYLIAIPGLMDAATAYEVSYNTNFLWPVSGRSEKASVLEDEWSSHSNVGGYKAKGTVNSTFVDITPVCIKFTSDVKAQTYAMTISTFSAPNANVTNLAIVPWTVDGNAISPTNYRPIEQCRNFTHYTFGSIHKYVYHFDKARLFYWHDKTINTTWWEQYKKAPISFG